MKIIDTVPCFLHNYEPSIDFLRSYYAKYPTIFTHYFALHCKDTDERHIESIRKYPHHFAAIKQVHENIVPVIEEIAKQYEKLYEITFPIDINLIVGGFGSNAYTNHQIIPDITFALEKLSPKLDHLRVIVAHEFGHAAQNIISDRAGMDWPNIHWTSPLLLLNQEGAATHFSRQTVLNVHPSIYFSYNDEGYEWLTFAEQNAETIKRAFADDYEVLTREALFREWFSINGGKTFGYSRLAYFIGDMFFQSQVKEMGEIEAIIAWKNECFEKQVKQWLFQ
ncbi:hypothetical protein [Bacillus sp. FJAT-22090]|uniref:hypothetical protein n=1 Tax=Bacillus sp. FJAT-22090 TaxID=1581038 RepID=UPI0011A91A7F|nr:hypothetical protein [Bacillus sp. FJAT-22090]